MFYETSNDFFLYQPETKTWATTFIKGTALVGCSTDIDYNLTNEQMRINKPVYLAVMANRQQLQPILDNPHLFDTDFIQAIMLVVRNYEGLQII